jgi:hypothetical protein
MGLWSHRRSHESMKRLYNWFYAHYGSIEESLGPELDMVVVECVVPLSDMTDQSINNLRIICRRDTNNRYKLWMLTKLIERMVTSYERI